MAKIYLFRTGHITDKNIFCGWLNFPLSKKGINEAKVVSKKLKDKKIDYGFCSDQLRGKQALVEVLKFHKKTKVIEEHRIRERHYGIFSGHEKELFKNLYPKKFKEIHRHKKANIPKGENFKEMEKRVFDFMRDLLYLIKKENVDVVICAHTNSMRLIRSYLEKEYDYDLIESYPTDLFIYDLEFE